MLVNYECTNFIFSIAKDGLFGALCLYPIILGIPYNIVQFFSFFLQLTQYERLSNSERFEVFLFFFHELFVLVVSFHKSSIISLMFFDPLHVRANQLLFFLYLLVYLLSSMILSLTIFTRFLIRLYLFSNCFVSVHNLANIVRFYQAKALQCDLGWLHENQLIVVFVYNRSLG